MFFCPHCGAQLQDDARFCGSCGSPVDAAPQPPVPSAPVQQMPVQATPPPVQPPYEPSGGQQPMPEGVTLGQDGKYHWYYEVRMFRNTAILGTILKIFGGIMLAVWRVTGLVDGFENFGQTTKMMLIIFGVLVAISLLAYALLAAMYGGRYCVLFEMDDQGIRHTQLPKQFKKAQMLGVITAIASGHPGAGILAAVRTSLYTSFSNVRSVKPVPGQHLIKVNAPLSKNQVYVEDANYQFVLDYIRAHCPKAK